jgi:EpsI family protein
MSQLNKNYLLAFSMLAAAIFAVAFKPVEKLADHREKVDLSTMIPSEFNVWRIDTNTPAQILSPEVEANLNKTYDQIFSKTYVNQQGEKIMLTIAYGSAQTQDLKAHRQEVCYRAQGYTIEMLRQENMQILNDFIPVTRMYATQRDRNEPVTYWFTMGNQLVLSRTERFLVQLKYALSGYIPDGFLIRISNLSNDPESAFLNHREFISALISSASAETANRLLGK